MEGPQRFLANTHPRVCGRYHLWPGNNLDLPELDPRHDRAGKMVDNQWVIFLSLVWQGKPARPVRLTRLSMVVGCAAPVRHSVFWNIVQPIAHLFGHGGSLGGFLAPVFSRRHLLRPAYHAPVSALSSTSLGHPFTPKPPRSRFRSSGMASTSEGSAASPPAVAEMGWSKGPSGPVRARQGP